MRKRFTKLEQQIWETVTDGRAQGLTDQEIVWTIYEMMVAA